MGLDADFNSFRDGNFIKFLKRLLRGDKDASYMSGIAEDFRSNQETLVKINKELSSRLGLVASLDSWAAFIEPPEATRFLMVISEVEDGADFLDAVVEQERPADSKALLEAFEKQLPNSMRALMLGVGGDARVNNQSTLQKKNILKPVNKSGLNLDAMRDFR